MNTQELELVAKWVISEKERGVSAIPKYIFEKAKLGLGLDIATPKFTHRVVRKKDERA